MLLLSSNGLTIVERPFIFTNYFYKNMDEMNKPVDGAEVVEGQEEVVAEVEESVEAEEETEATETEEAA